MTLQGTFLTPDEMVDGMTPAMVTAVFDQIERQAAFVLKLTTYALKVLLLGADDRVPDLMLDEQMLRFVVRSTLTSEASTTQLQIHKLTAEQIEASADQWAYLVPASVHIRAALAHIMAQRYPMRYQSMPRTAAALGFDTLAACYQQRYGHTLEEAFKRADSGMSVMSSSAMMLINTMRSKMEWVTLERGDVLLREGEPSDSIYVLGNGRLKVLQGQPEDEQVIAQLSQGAIIGEFGFLSDEPRTASIVAARASVVIRLPRQSYDFISKSFPTVQATLIKSMLRRMNTAPGKVAYEPPVLRTIALVGTGAISPDVVTALQNALARFGSVLHLNSSTLDTQAFAGALAALNDPQQRSLVNGWMNDQESKYRIVLYEADVTATSWTQQCLQQADHILLITDAALQPSPQYPTQTLLANSDPDITRDLVLVHPAGAQPHMTQRWLDAYPVKRHFHIALDRPETVARLARFMVGRAVGVVFGGGGARGFAHIGVMQALREAGIPIDIVGGASAGAIIAAFTALERSVEKAIEIGQRDLSNFVDFTLPMVSMASGKRLQKGLEAVVGDGNIEDLWVKFFCVSTNLSRSSLRIHDRGSLRRSIRASASIPGVFPPIIDDNDTRDVLVDGGVMNNIPTDVMQQYQPGMMIVVELGADEGPRRSTFNNDEVLSGLRVLFNRLNPLRKQRIKAPSMTGTLFRVIMMNDASKLAERRSAAHIYMTLDLKKYSIFKAKSVAELAQVGYEHAQTAIKEWQTANPDTVW